MKSRLSLVILSFLAATVPAASEGVAQGRTAQGTEYMVAAPTAEAMEAGREILELGGTAIDAAAATAFATAPIPGGPAAVEQMLREYGTLTLEEVLQPAIRVAEEGFVVQPDLHSALRTQRDR